VKGYVQAAPPGSGITFTIYVGDTASLTLTIPAGRPCSRYAVTDRCFVADPGNTAVCISITAVGTIFPGASLSVFIYS
jgi:hypothetical protein